MNELVLIALTLDTAFSLREITGTPRAIQIVKCDQTILYVGARAHLGRAAHQDAHLTAAYLCEQFPLFDLRIGIVDERDPVLAETVCRAAVNVVVRGQQVHGRIIGVGIPAAAVALHGALILHSALMLLIAPKVSGIMLDQQVQALEQAAFMGKCL